MGVITPLPLQQFIVLKWTQRYIYRILGILCCHLCQGFGVVKRLSTLNQVWFYQRRICLSQLKASKRIIMQIRGETCYHVVQSTGHEGSTPHFWKTSEPNIECWNCQCDRYHPALICLWYFRIFAHGKIIAANGAYHMNNEVLFSWYHGERLEFDHCILVVKTHLATATWSLGSSTSNLPS